MAATLLILLMLVAWLRPTGETAAVVRFTKPTATAKPELRPGVPYSVEGIAALGDSVYVGPPTIVILRLIERSDKFGEVIHGEWIASYAPDTKKFSGTVSVSKGETLKRLYLGAVAVDEAGRHHRVPIAEEIPVSIATIPAPIKKKASPRG